MTAPLVEEQPGSLSLRDPTWVGRLVRLLRPLLFGYFRAEVRGLDRLPPGPALLVANHSGGMAPGDFIFFLGFYAHFGTEEPLYILGHRLFSRRRGMRRLLARFGVIEGSPEHAHAALRQGAKVLVYPGGDHDSLRPFSQRARVCFGGRRGFLRIATQAQVPLVPVATAGSHETFVVLVQGKRLAARLGFLRRLGLHSFPVILCLPWLVAIGPMCLLPYFPFPSRVTVEVGPVLHSRPAPASSDALETFLDVRYREVVSAMETLLAGLYAERRFSALD